MKRSVLAFALPAALGMVLSCSPDAGVVSPGRVTGRDGSVGLGGTGAVRADSGVSDGGQVIGIGGQIGGGGASSSGGRAGTGATTGSGGAVTTGGAAGRGSGGTGTGGRGGTGVGTATGGRGTGGTGTGGAGTGGAGTGGAPVSTSCGTLGTAHNGNGSFTFYFFGQGTAQEGNGFRTACGYFGTESGQVDTVQNIATPATYFVAIPGLTSTNFNTVSSCGACVELTGANGARIVATIIDECPQNSNPVCNANPTSHLDISRAAFDQLGFPVGNPSGTTWRWVPCPVSGNVRIRVKSGNPNEVFVENSILAVQGVSLNGTQATRQSYGAWHFNSNLAVGQTLNLTDAAARAITVTIATIAQNVNQDTGRQFPACQ